MDFIAAHYLWFVGVGLILLMAVIGYLAEKTDFIAKQKEKDKKRKEKAEKQKLEKIAKEKEKFNKEIGDGEDLVLEENNITYPVELDHPATTVEIPVAGTPESMEELGDLEPTGELKIPDIQNAMYNYDINNNELDKPLENGVLNLDAYDTKKPVESTESIAEMKPVEEVPEIVEPTIENIGIEEITPAIDASIVDVDSEKNTSKKEKKSKGTIEEPEDADSDVWKF